MPTVEIPISDGVFENADSFELAGSAYAAELKNMLINDFGTNIGRPGLSTFASIANHKVEGLYPFGDYVVCVTSDRKIWAIDSAGLVTQIHDAVLEGTARPVFADDGTYVAIAGGGAPKRWDGNIANQTADMPGSPADCTHINYLDGYWVNHLLTDQECRFAGPTSAARETWTSTDAFQAEGLPDNITSQAVNIRELYLFGSTTTEIWQNFGDSSLPFARTFFIDKGCAAAYSVAHANNTLFWLSNDRQFVRMDGRTPMLISGPFDRTIKAMSTVSDCWGTVVDIGEHYLIVWTFPTEGKCYAYDYGRNKWSEWDGREGGARVNFRMHSHCWVPAWNKHLVGDRNNGTIYELSTSTYADGSNPRRVLRKTAWIDHGTGTRKRSNYYELELKRGVGIPGGTEPVVMIRVRDDDKPWSDYVHVGLGFTGDSEPTTRVRLRGVYRRRQVEIVLTDGVEFRLNKLRENVDVMVS